MPRVHHVLNARKDNPAVKKGESYYWWAFRYGGKRYSVTRPKSSQLTQSSFLGGMYSIQESFEETTITTLFDAQSYAEEAAGNLRELGEEAADSLANMPEGLQEGDVGQMLQERCDYAEEMADTLENIDFEEIDEDEIRGDLQNEDDETIEAEIASAREAKLTEAAGEIDSALEYQGS